MSGNQKRTFEYRIGDEISYAGGSGMMYGEVVRIVTSGEAGAVEIEWEDGRREIKKVRDQAIRLLRRRGGVSEADEQRGPRDKKQHDRDISEAYRSDLRKR
ncbi:MAG: hypothetical protein K1Y36_04500 [Blastocatellia bacterium]|nr:hypothetical protein [Blastocatellia bacterium]